MTSYDLTTHAAGVLALAGEGWLRLSGKDTKPFLHRMISAHVEKLPNGEGTRGLLLNVKGHIEADLRVFAVADDEVFALVPARVHADVAAKLEKYIVMDEVVLEDLATPVVTVQGPRARDVVASLFPSLPPLDKENAHAVVNGARVLRHDRSGLGGFDVVGGDASALIAAAKSLGGGALDPEVLDLITIENAVPVLGRDFGPEQLPQETRLFELGFVAIDKCYVGQEVVSRLHYRGHANRLLAAFALDEPPAPGSKLEKDGKEVGWITSSARSPRSGRAVALGYVRREHAGPGTILQVSGSGTRAEVGPIPWLPRS